MCVREVASEPMLEIVVLYFMVKARESEYTMAMRKDHIHLKNKAKNEREFDKVSCDHDTTKEK